MIVELRIALVGLATFTAVGLLAAALVPSIVPRSRRSAANLAAHLEYLRLLPAGAAGLAALLVTGAFLMFEPRWDGERVSVVVQVLAAVGLFLIGAAACRGLVLAVLTRRMLKQWLRAGELVNLPGFAGTACAVTSDFPIVAVVGIIRPRLIIARSVLASCSEAELRAVLAHEQGHIDRRDNMRRLLMSVAPDVLGWLPASARISAAWHDAAEEAADDAAGRNGADGRLKLASALVKVARLATAARCPSVLPASALYRGEDLNHRVRRLLGADLGVAAGPQAGRLLSVCGALVVTVSLVMLERVHDVVEGLIHILP